MIYTFRKRSASWVFSSTQDQRGCGSRRAPYKQCTWLCSAALDSWLLKKSVSEWMNEWCCPIVFTFWQPSLIWATLAQKNWCFGLLLKYETARLVPFPLIYPPLRATCCGLHPSASLSVSPNSNLQLSAGTPAHKKTGQDHTAGISTSGHLL